MDVRKGPAVEVNELFNILRAAYLFRSGGIMGGETWGLNFVRYVQVPLIEGLLDEALNEGLVLFGSSHRESLLSPLPLAGRFFSTQHDATNRSPMHLSMNN